MGSACHNQTISALGDANGTVPGAYSDPDGRPASAVPPQPQVCWERFIQKKTIKVLLVENDDSTRQVVSALLRHCMYEEVAMPGVSGISLLSRIMNHNICKNIPVIMISSNDAMGTVFKCLSKGAVDFLVKPIRKNELKNLWQHVWRRCHSSSGSGSESGIQTQKCAKSKSGDESDNNSSNDEDEDNGVSMGLNARDGSDNGSGTQAQSSWTKHAVEIDSPQAMSPDQLADPTDSTCAQVIHPKSEICSNRWLPCTSNKNCKKQKETNDDFKGKDMEIGSPRNLNIAYKSSPNERSINPTDRRCEYPLQKNLKEAVMENLEEPIVRAADLIGSMAKNMDAQQAARAANAPNCSAKVPEGKDKNRDNIMPSLELSLKRSRSTGDGANAIQEEQRNVPYTCGFQSRWDRIRRKLFAA
uniref:Response regulatory domain-containing protein n=1 Tax=Leersia perrieri TaxID=77586 RepID=A0A0D9X3A9_9ORYZ